MLPHQIKTPSQLKAFYEQAVQEGKIIGGHFFERKTMRFFGDTMRNYGLRDAGAYWELYRKRPAKHGRKESAFFDKATFKQVFNIPRGN